MVIGFLNLVSVDAKERSLVSKFSFKIPTYFIMISIDNDKRTQVKDERDANQKVFPCTYNSFFVFRFTSPSIPYFANFNAHNLNFH